MSFLVEMADFGFHLQCHGGKVRIRQAEDPYEQVWDVLVPATERPQAKVLMGEWATELYPLVMTNIAIESGHRNSEFYH